MNKENCTLKLIDEIILYYDAGRKNIELNKNNIRRIYVAMLQTCIYLISYCGGCFL